MIEVPEAEALKRRKENWTSMYAYPWRYKRTMNRLADLMKESLADKLVIHVVGVGEGSGVQVREMISLLKNRTNKPIEMHVSDFKREYLEHAVEAAKQEYPDVEIVGHEVDLGAPKEMPARKADVIICTNVLNYLDNGFEELGLHHLSSSMKVGGYLLLSHMDERQVRSPKDRYGLELRERHREELPSYAHPDTKEEGLIFQKTGGGQSFSEIWERVKHW